MNKELIKNELESYVYDYQYYLEKIKERDKALDEINKSIKRVTTIGENMKDSTKISENLEYLLLCAAKEEEILINFIKRKQRIESTIKNLQQPEKTILYFKYIRFLTFDEIATKMHYSTKRIYQLHAIALEKYTDEYMKLVQNVDNVE